MNKYQRRSKNGDEVCLRRLIANLQAFGLIRCRDSLDVWRNRLVSTGGSFYRDNNHGF